MSTFTVATTSAVFSTIADLSCADVDLSSIFEFLSPLDELSADLPVTCAFSDVGIFSALADIPPPKKISDATATLAAPKWYFLIEKRVSFSPFLYWYLINIITPFS